MEDNKTQCSTPGVLSQETNGMLNIVCLFLR